MNRRPQRPHSHAIDAVLIICGLVCVIIGAADGDAPFAILGAALAFVSVALLAKDRELDERWPR